MSAQYICFSFTVNAAFSGTKEAWLNLEGRAARMYVVLIFYLLFIQGESTGQI